MELNQNMVLCDENQGLGHEELVAVTDGILHAMKKLVG